MQTKTLRFALFLVTALTTLAAKAPVQAHGEGSPGGDSNVESVDKPFGRTGDPKRVSRTILISGDDQMRFTPSKISVKRGETIRFVLRNDGRVMHEMVLGTLTQLKEHADLMKKHPGMEHDEPYMTHVGPGKTGQIVWTFDKPGEFHFACLVPGHFEAGMRGTINVLVQ
jgi:uncharacterized cupredoxin-like copper-binding protein